MKLDRRGNTKSQNMGPILCLVAQNCNWLDSVISDLQLSYKGARNWKVDWK